MLPDTPLSSLSVPHPSALALLLFSCSVMSESLQSHGSQQARLPCPSLSPGVCSNWITASQASLSFTISWSLLKLMSPESVMPSSHLILCRPLLLLPSTFASNGVFSTELALCIRWSKYWSFSISSSDEHSGLISFRIDWFDLLAIQGTLKSLLQHHSSKAPILQCSLWFNSHICT